MRFPHTRTRLVPSMSPSPSPIANVHYKRNEGTFGDRAGFAEHRRHVMGVIAGAANSTRPSLCVLGAGNGNDLDLDILANHFDEICLVDLDTAALQQCVSRLPQAIARRITLKAGVDLSGILPTLDALQAQRSISHDQISELSELAREFPPQIELGRWDVVVSTCLVSQLIDSVVMAVGAEHPGCSDLILSVRDGHLGGIAALTKDRGASILITDFVSSDTLPQLPQVPEAELQSLVHHAVSNRNFFTGLNPAVLLERMHDWSLRRNVAVKTHPAWRWTLGPRCFAVCAIEIAP
ncbi:hypothetical protein Pla52o_31450 [Novipirellula galeiformis]|uniref:Uncharacterized protein n=1 Tax=Novipirellula galeiformis TaxID=2528004 RepID=A0A5C6CEB1_9BACT|nr:hypothetical protein [Novipirellula galeiformis]TWU22097.1 hypothetical protein Pla52o_31450 [Novipirellula galeiformis]